VLCRQWLALDQQDALGVGQLGRRRRASDPAPTTITSTADAVDISRGRERGRRG
jgi:hypothetical protein